MKYLPSLLCAAALLSTAAASELTLSGTMDGPEVGNFASLLEASGGTLDESTDLVIRGKMAIAPPDKQTYECANLKLVVDTTSGRTVSPALYFQMASMNVAEDVFVEVGTLGPQRGKLTWGGTAVLGSGGSSNTAALELLYSESIVDGGTLVLSPNGTMAFRIHDKAATQRILAGRPEPVDLEGKLEVQPGAKIQLRFGADAIVEAETFPEGEYQLIRTKGGIEGPMPELVTLHERDVVDNGRFSLKKSGGVLLLVVAP